MPSPLIGFHHLRVVAGVADPPRLLGDNRLHHKLALAKARAICECQFFQGMGFYKSFPITNIAKVIRESPFPDMSHLGSLGGKTNSDYTHYGLSSQILYPTLPHINFNTSRGLSAQTGSADDHHILTGTQTRNMGQ